MIWAASFNLYASWLVPLLICSFFIGGFAAGLFVLLRFRGRGEPGQVKLAAFIFIGILISGTVLVGVLLRHKDLGIAQELFLAERAEQRVVSGLFVSAGSLTFASFDMDSRTVLERDTLKTEDGPVKYSLKRVSGNVAEVKLGEDRVFVDLGRGLTLGSLEERLSQTEQLRGLAFKLKSYNDEQDEAVVQTPDGKRLSVNMRRGEPKHASQLGTGRYCQALSGAASKAIAGLFRVQVLSDRKGRCHFSGSRWLALHRSTAQGEGALLLSLMNDGDERPAWTAELSERLGGVFEVLKARQNGELFELLLLRDRRALEVMEIGLTGDVVRSWTVF